MPTHIFRGLISGSLLALTAASAVADPATAATIRELDVYYDDPTTPAGVESRRVFDIVRDGWDLRNETGTGSMAFTGLADGDRLPGGARTTNGADPYGVAYGGGRADIRFALIDDELYLLSKSDGMVRAVAAADLVLDVAAGSLTQADAGYPLIDWGLSLTKTGGGTLVLDADNGFTGPVTVTGGTLTVARTGALAPTSLAIESDGTLALPAAERTGLAVASLDLAAGGRLDLGGGFVTIAAGGCDPGDGTRRQAPPHPLTRISRSPRTRRRTVRAGRFEKPAPDRCGNAIDRAIPIQRSRRSCSSSRLSGAQYRRSASRSASSSARSAATSSGSLPVAACSSKGLAV